MKSWEIVTVILLVVFAFFVGMRAGYVRGYSDGIDEGIEVLDKLGDVCDDALRDVEQSARDLFDAQE